MMKIKQIYWESNNALEASVIVTDGLFDVTVFCQPCTAKIGDIISGPLISFETKNLIRSSETRASVNMENHKYHFKFIAKVISSKEGVVSVGGLKIDVGNIPKDIVDNDYVEFLTTRLDL